MVLPPFGVFSNILLLTLIVTWNLFVLHNNKMKLVDGYVICAFVLNHLSMLVFFLYRESESGLINCFIDGVKELLPFDFNNFELRGVAQYGDLVINIIFVEVD